jgi:hypothetical protein
VRIMPDIDRVDGLPPPGNETIDIEWDSLTGMQLGEQNTDEVTTLVTRILVKWDDLQYEECEHNRRHIVNCPA